MTIRKVFFRAFLILLSIISVTPSVCSASSIKTVGFRELSDRTLTETGKEALKIYGDAWQHAETKHFVYHFYDAKDGEPVVVHAESYYAWSKELLSIPEDPTKSKSHVFIFSDRDVWKGFVQKTPEKLPGAEAFTNGVELFLYRDPFWLGTPHTLAHEITHLVLARFLEGELPLFLNEGFAEFMAVKAIAMKAGGDPYSVRTLQSIAEKDFIEMEKLIGMKNYPEDATIFYRQSELLIRYLINHGEKKLYDLLRRASGGEAFSGIVEDLYEMDLEALAKKFKMYAMTRTA